MGSLVPTQGGGGPYRTAAGAALAASPRRLPWERRLPLLFGDAWSWFGWIWLGTCAVTASLAPGGGAMLVYPLFGLIFAGQRFWRGRREVRLLQRGRLTQGKLVRERSTPMWVAQRRVHELTVDFTDHLGQARRVVAATPHHERLFEEQSYWVLYDPDKPQKAVLLAAIPGDPRIEADGVIRFDA